MIEGLLRHCADAEIEATALRLRDRGDQERPGRLLGPAVADLLLRVDDGQS